MFLKEYTYHLEVVERQFCVLSHNYPQPLHVRCGFSTTEVLAQYRALALKLY